MIYPKDKLEQLRKRWLTPHGRQLVKIIKETHCYLSPVLFHEKIHNLPFINDEEVAEAVDLRGIHLSGFDFRVMVPDDDDGGFSEPMAILSSIHFEGAILKHCKFEGGKLHHCYFEEADLSHAEFENATLNNCHFEKANLTGTFFNSAKLINTNLSEAEIRDISLNLALTDQRTTFGKELKSEKDKDYHSASIEYKQLTELYKNSNFHTQADEYHYRQMVAKRKTYSLSDPRRWTSYIFGDLLCKHGTSFLRVFAWAVIIVLACAAAFYYTDSLLYNQKDVHISFFDSVYFSLVTFTTLGYGDFHAIGWIRFLAGIESLFGMVLMALFTVIVGRSIIRE